MSPARLLGAAFPLIALTAALYLAAHAAVQHLRSTPTTRSLRYARANLSAAVILFAAACYTTTAGQPWLCVPGFYASAFFVWCTARDYANHRRTLDEHEWARRRALGEHPPPLDPCCRLARHADGGAHGPDCTDEFHRIVARHNETEHDPRSAA